MEEIKNQLIFLLGSFLSGILVMLAYEAVNIFRGLFRPGVFGRLFLDVVFFIISGVCVFQMILELVQFCTERRQVHCFPIFL